MNQTSTLVRILCIMVEVRWFDEIVKSLFPARQSMTMAVGVIVC